MPRTPDDVVRRERAACSPLTRVQRGSRTTWCRDYDRTDRAKLWARACAALGLDGGIVHDLRRSGVKHLIGSGNDPHTVMAFSGHRTASMLKRLPHHRPGRPPPRGRAGGCVPGRPSVVTLAPVLGATRGVGQRPITSGSVIPVVRGSYAHFSTDNLYYLAAEKHGSLAIARTFGTLAEGGEFESVFARLLLYWDGRIGAVEQFELEHLDVARARFAELRPSTSTSVSADHDAGGAR